MKIAVSSDGTDLEALASPVFGRCAAFVFVETETMAFEAVANPALTSPSGAGIQAAQLVIERGAQAVITGHVGPNAYAVFASAGVRVYPFANGTVRQAVEAFKAGHLQPVAGASAPAHGGLGMGGGRGPGMDGGRGAGVAAAALPSAAPPPAEADAREQGLAALGEQLAAARGQLAQVLEGLDRLEQHGSGPAPGRSGTQTVRIAVSADDNRGLDGVVSPHFGRCPYYVLVDVADRQVRDVRAIENPYYGQHAPGVVPEFIHRQGAQVMLTGGMGGRAIAYFQQYGIEPVTGAFGSVRHALGQYLSGALQGAAPCRESVAHGHELAPEPSPYEQDEAGRLREEIEMLERQLNEALERLNRLQAG